MNHKNAPPKAWIYNCQSLNHFTFDSLVLMGIVCEFRLCVWAYFIWTFSSWIRIYKIELFLNAMPLLCFQRWFCLCTIIQTRVCASGFPLKCENYWTTAYFVPVFRIYFSTVSHIFHSIDTTIGMLQYHRWTNTRLCIYVALFIHRARVFVGPNQKFLLCVHPFVILCVCKHNKQNIDFFLNFEFPLLLKVAEPTVFGWESSFGNVIRMLNKWKTENFDKHLMEKLNELNTLIPTHFFRSLFCRTGECVCVRVYMFFSSHLSFIH